VAGRAAAREPRRAARLKPASPPHVSRGELSLDSALFRRAALWGSTRTPEWFVRAAPPVVGLVVCALAGEPRRRIAQNLTLVRGERGALRDAVDVGSTFASYASCLAEILGAGSRHGRLPAVLVHGELHAFAALEGGHGVILATAHTGGWESVGPVLTRDLGLRVMIAETPERDAGASEIQDRVRRAQGLLVTHVGDDPLSALPLARHLREGGAVALQLDRLPSGQRRRAITLFDRPGHIPEGPLRLAAVTGAPVLPVFAARTGHRRYEVHIFPPQRIARDAPEAELNRAAQALGDAMQTFLRAHPTQWFHFG
jgi:lauroyl/myristoyl acyltransferase